MVYIKIHRQTYHNAHKSITESTALCTSCFKSNVWKCTLLQIDGFTLEEALWVIRARFQGNKAAKCTFFFIFPFWVSFSRRNFYRKRRNPFSVFNSVSETIELGISLLIRVTEVLFLWLERLRLDQITNLVLIVKKSCAHNIHSIDSKTLGNLEKRLLRILYVFRYQIWNQYGIWRKTYILLPCFLEILPDYP